MKAGSRLSDKQAEKLAARVAGGAVQITVVASEADAIKQLGL